MSTSTLTRSGRVRDSQRQRLYDAEHDTAWGKADRAMTLAECQIYVNRLCAQQWTQRHWRIWAPPTVSDGRGSPQARYVSWNNTIEMPCWSRTEWTLLHEMAHFLSDRCLRNCNGVDGLPCRQEAAHGWHFAQIYLALVRHQLGKAVHDVLRGSFRRGRVRYTRPRRAS